MNVVLVGCGRMGGALLRGWRAAGVSPVFVVDPSIVDPSVVEAEDVQVLPSLEAVAVLDGPKCMVLAVKPAMVEGVLRTLAPSLTSAAMTISVAAGVTLATLRQAAGEAPMVIRAMPNTPAAIGKGVIAAVSDRLLDPEASAQAERLLSAVGAMVWLEQEAMIEAVTAVSGSGPAYFYRFTEALAEAGRALGLPAEIAAHLAGLTFTGAAALMDSTGQPPGDLRAEVTSPNGVTAAALSVFDRDDALSVLVRAATLAAVRRSEAMGKGAG